MKNIKLSSSSIVICILLFVYSACNKPTIGETSITKPLVKGVIQKGPFLNGTSIGIHELKAELSPTGKVYSSQILDNSGQFQLKDLALASQY